MSVFGGKRREASDQSKGAKGATGPPSASSAQTPAPAQSVAKDDHTARPPHAAASGKPAGGNVANIGKSISIHGDLTGDEDLLLEGTVEGKVKLPNNELTIGADGRIPADVSAKSVIVIGHVKGDVDATERVEIRESGVVEGNIRSPRLIVKEGALIRGSLEMGGKQAAKQPSAAPAKKASESRRPSASTAPPPPPAG